MTTASSAATGTRAPFFFAASGVFLVLFVGWTSLIGAGVLTPLDRDVAEYWRDHGGGAWELMKFCTDLGSVATLSMVALLGAVWQFSHGRRDFGSAWFGIVLTGALLNVLLKTGFDRPRPPESWRDRAVLETNESYPSGHAMGSVLDYGVLCYALLRQTRIPLRRTLIALFFASFVAGIGFSRIYLRAHWFSDVVGGYCAGLFWLCFWLGWIERRRHRLAATRSGART